MEELKQIWQATLDSLRSEYSDTSMQIFFNDLVLTDLTDKVATLDSETEFKRDIIQNRYRSSVEKHLSLVLGQPVTIAVRLSAAVAADPTKPVSAINMLETPAFRRSNRYTFDNFIVGNSNSFAHAAALNVATDPDSGYNPLFIYGASGLGKTHLLYAIADRMMTLHPEMKVIYVKGEEFTNEMIDSISRGTRAAFRDKYRRADMLLIDDIQFIAGRESTQEEFFNTFNALYEDHRQIVITSDKPPRDMKTLEDRLRTRFEWGVIADIQPPDYELRISIMKKKAELLRFDFADEVLEFLAENLHNDVRQMEGAIKKIGAQSLLNGRPITVELARSCISDLITAAEPVTVTADKIIEQVGVKYGVSADDIKSRRQQKDVAMARHVAIYLIRRMTELSFPLIAKIFGRDHSTIMSSYRLIDGEMRTNVVFESEITDLIKAIRSGS